MNNRLRLAVSLGLGAAMTVSAGTLGWRLLLNTLTPAVDSRANAEVKCEAERLLYFTHGEVLIFPARIHPTAGDTRYLVQIPDKKRWIREMPHWSRHSRSDVIADLKRLVAEQPVDLVEAGSTTGLQIR